jgi:hypothetical protein
MRKPYEKPEIVVVEMDTCYMSSSSFVMDSDSKGDFDEDFVRDYRRRGTWGNLWADINNTTNTITQ